LDYLFADRVRRIGCDLYHEPNFLPFDVDAPTISTIHDLSVIRYPQWHPKDRVHEFEKRFEKALSNCTHFLTDLEFVKQELVSEFNVPSEKITATPLGIRSGLSPLPIPEARAILKELNLPQKYFLHLGTIEPRKNLLFLMQLYCDLPLRVREQYPLLLVGGWGWNAEKEAAFYEETAKHHNVILSGYIPDDKISAVYNCARALLAPSHYEGFGLPPVEMMACGGAVLASKIGAHQEVCGTTASYFHPEDKDAWRDALLQIAWDDEWHRALRKGAVEKAARFSWHQCALDTYCAYEKVLGINATPALIPSAFKKAC
jgi:alpha-1,3-rhamnosyl/mannosyltransferase